MIWKWWRRKKCKIFFGNRWNTHWTSCWARRNKTVKPFFVCAQLCWQPILIKIIRNFSLICKIFYEILIHFSITIATREIGFIFQLIRLTQLESNEKKILIRSLCMTDTRLPLNENVFFLVFIQKLKRKKNPFHGLILLAFSKSFCFLLLLNKLDTR